MTQKFKKLILDVNSINFEELINVVGTVVWFIGYIISSIAAWGVLLGIFPSTGFYAYAAVSCLFFGIFGLATLMFPLIIVYVIWEFLVQWAQSGDEE